MTNNLQREKKRFCLSCDKETNSTPCSYCGGGSFKYKSTPPTDTTVAKYKRWLEQERPGLPPMPQDYIDSQIEAVELYLQWINGEGL